MREFKKVNRIFVKSSNTSSKILNRYTYSLIVFPIFMIMYFLFVKEYKVMFNYVKGLFLSFVLSIIIQYIINLIKNKKSFKSIFFEDNVIAISIIMSFFIYTESIIVSIIALLITNLSKVINKNISISSVAYGILFILIYRHFNGMVDTPLYNLSNLNYVSTYELIFNKYGSFISYLFGFNLYYINSLLSILVFGYLFYKKSIKYNIILSYIGVIFVFMLFFGLFKGMNIWYVFFQIFTGNLLFLTVYCLGDYKSTPISIEGGIIYGILLGIITLLLRFIVPEFASVVILVIGPLLLTKFIDRISNKLKYNRKFYYLCLSVCFFLLGILYLGVSIIF